MRIVINQIMKSNDNFIKQLRNRKIREAYVKPETRTRKKLRYLDSMKGKQRIIINV